MAKGESWQQVAKNNKIKDPRKLKIGQKVKVNGQTRTIKKGDTLFGLTRGSRGKSASAPGHNKPAGQKNAVGRGKERLKMTPADGSATGLRGGGYTGGGGGKPRPPIGAKPAPPGGFGGHIGFNPVEGRPVSPKPVDPGFNQMKPVSGPITRAPGAGGGNFGPRDPVGPIKRTSPNPGVVPKKQAAGTVRYQAYKAAPGQSVGKMQMRAASRNAAVAAKTKPKTGRKLPG